MAKKKDPKKVAAGKKGARARWNKNRNNPAKGILNTGKNMILKSFFAVGGGFAVAKLIQVGIDKFGDKLPAKVVEFAPIATPVGLGAVTGFFGRDNFILSNAATGMMISGVNTGFNKFLPADQTTNLSGVQNNKMLSDGELIIGQDGKVRTADGVVVANAELDESDEDRFLGDGLDEDKNDKFLGDSEQDVTFSDKEELFVP